MPGEKTCEVATFGNFVTDVIVNVERLPVHPDLHQNLTQPLRITLGGCANALIAAARLDANACALGLIPPPCDTTSRLLTSNVYDTLKRNKINVDTLIPHVEGRFNSCIVLTPPHPTEHTFISTNGDIQKKLCSSASVQGLAGFSFPAALISSIEKAHCVLLDAYVLMNTPASQILELIRHCKASTHLYFDAQTAPPTPLSTQILESIKGLFLTVPAALTLTQADTIHDAMEQLPKLVPRDTTILLKQGPRGAILIHTSDPIEHIPITPFQPKCITDTVGAGDAFAGAYLTGVYTYGWDKRTAAIMASAMGAATCENRGTGEEGIGTIDQVMRLLDQKEDGVRVRGKLKDQLNHITLGKRQSTVTMVN